MNSQLELWITKKMGSDSALEPGSEMDLPWKRLHGAYAQSRCAQELRDGQLGVFMFGLCPHFMLLNWKQHAACLMPSIQSSLLENMLSSL